MMTARSNNSEGVWAALRRSRAGVAGALVLGAMMLACLGSLPYTLGTTRADPVAGTSASVRYDDQNRYARNLPPTLGLREVRPDTEGRDTPEQRLYDAAVRSAYVAEARWHNSLSKHPLTTADQLQEWGSPLSFERPENNRVVYLLGTDLLGRSLLIRSLAGGGISLVIGLCAATLSVLLGTLYGSIAGYVGGRTDALMMRIVDILYGLPSILLVVLLSVAVNSVLDRVQARGGISPQWVQTVRLITLLVAIGGVSWLTMARVIRGQVMSLKNQLFVEAARAMGVSTRGIFLRHLLPNLVGPIVVYATLTVPQAILQESFLSFLGIGVAPPMPSWGNLAAEGLSELNAYRSHWWLILFPCAFLGVTLLALNFMGEGLREALDPKRAK